MTVFGKFVSLLLLITIFSGGYYAMSLKNKSEEGDDIQNMVATSTFPAQKKISFSELIQQQGTYICDISQHVQGTTASGTVYLHKEKIKGLFSITVNGQIITSEVLVLDGYTYTWMSIMKGVGYKVKSKDTTIEGSSTQPLAYAWNADSVGGYSCKEWDVDESVFVLPKEITFTEVKK